jgi:hypothetical protein
MAKARAVLPLFRVFYTYTPQGATRARKFSLLVPAEDADDALRRATADFARQSIDLTRVEFREILPDILS